MSSRVRRRQSKPRTVRAILVAFSRGGGMQDDVLIRHAETTDAAAVERLLLASYPALMANSYDAETLARALPLMTRANPRLLASGTYYVAEARGDIVGCGGWSPEEPGTRRIVLHTGHVRHFAVDPNHVRRGVGRALFERCESQARENGIDAFECFASRNAVEFYRSVGFEVVREIEVQMASATRFPSILMRKSFLSRGR